MADSWYYYFSSVAQTIAAASALLMALALIRLQYLSNGLQDVQRLLAEAFFRVARQDEYRRDVSPHFLREEWQAYLHMVRQLKESSAESFPASGEYTATVAYVDSLIDQGRYLHAKRMQLHRSLGHAFVGTVFFAFVSIAAIPVAQWVTPCLLYWVWGISGCVLAALFFLYCRVVHNTLEQGMETKHDER